MGQMWEWPAMSRLVSFVIHLPCGSLGIFSSTLLPVLSVHQKSSKDLHGRKAGSRTSGPTLSPWDTSGPHFLPSIKELTSTNSCDSCHYQRVQNRPALYFSAPSARQQLHLAISEYKSLPSLSPLFPTQFLALPQSISLQ